MENVQDTVQTDESQVQPTEAEIQGKKVTGETPAESEKPKSEELPEGVKRRIAKLTAEKYILKEKLKQAQLQNQDLNKKPEFPNPKSFEDEYGNLKQKEWSEAVSNYEDLRDNWKTAQNSIKQDDGSIRKELADAQTKFYINGAKMAEKTPDFFQVINQPNTYTVPLGNVLFTMEDGHELAYWLGKNKEEAIRIGKLDPESMVDELEALRQKINVKPRTVSLAPKPINPIDGGDVEITDIDKIKDDQAWWEARKRERLKKLKG